MRTVYADTGAFIALIWTRDRAHARIRDHFLRLRREGDLIVTSEPVIAETATRLRYDAGVSVALAFRDALQQAEAAGVLRIRYGNAQLMRAAFEVMSRYQDLRLSYADCVGATVARETRVDAVFGLDADFRAMGLLLEP